MTSLMRVYKEYMYVRKKQVPMEESPPNEILLSGEINFSYID